MKGDVKEVEKIKQKIQAKVNTEKRINMKKKGIL